MRAFAELLDNLVLTQSRNRKVELLVRHFRDCPDPDRGLALAAITGDLELPSVKPALIRQLAGEVCDPELFRLSYDFVGDLAETVSLIWPSKNDAGDPPGLGSIVADLSHASRTAAPAMMRRLLDAMDASERYALIKLATGGLRVGVSARLAKQALAEFGNVDIGGIEELWHGLKPPYEALFAWLEGRAAKPVSAAPAPFRPVMLSHAAEERDIAAFTSDEYVAEWKWDGIRVQAVSEAGIRRLYTRTGDDISAGFPDLVDAIQFTGAIDGELLVRDAEGSVAPFSALQQRLNRKSVSRKLMREYPAFVRAYDILVDGDDDIRSLTWLERRRRLEALVATLSPERVDLSPPLAFASLDELRGHRENPPETVIEGLMIKRLDSVYVAGRPRGPWFKWKRDPRLVDAVLMYAQRGHGKRSGYYSDYTFGVWRGSELVPVGKAYFGFTDEELKRIDKFVRDHTVERFGPVRSVRADAGHGLVLEIAFEGLNRSTRHKSGVAMRFPRISRLRWDKPPAEADRLETLEAMLD
ncbi:MAG: cisplatin damage response ATP-dependent DNA ligase [Nitratireductor sp.]